ncbi:hypothetical protein H311_01846 [Anncaliia algerae PRA109]|nr:hypothetical protein H311_01846 [Anncaliia algerae PRA109]
MHENIVINLNNCYHDSLKCYYERSTKTNLNCFIADLGKQCFTLWFRREDIQLKNINLLDLSIMQFKKKLYLFIREKFFKFHELTNLVDHASSD